MQNNQFSYFIVPGLNLFGGDIEDKQNIFTFEEAVLQCKSLIGGDHTKCATIVRNGENNYGLWVKTSAKTNASNSPIHPQSTSVFYGQMI